MDNNIIWAIALLAVALILFVVELFIPSGGLIGLAAATTLVAGVVFLFKVNTTAGLIGALVAVAGLPFLFAMGIRVWPNTPIARMLSLETTQRAEDDRVTSPIEGAVASEQLIGAAGKAITDLRPVGTCLINGQRAECLAESGLIRAGTPVVVVSADGMQIKVRAEETA